MKAIIKATGEIVEVYESCTEDFPWTDEKGNKIWKTEELVFLETTDNTPDYWTRLKHNVAINALGSFILTNNIKNGDLEGMRECITNAMAIAHTLVEKLKVKKEK